MYPEGCVLPINTRSQAVIKAIEFSKLLPEKKVSMAKLQGHFCKHTSDPQKAIDKYQELLVEKKKNGMVTLDNHQNQILTMYLKKAYVDGVVIKL